MARRFGSAYSPRQWVRNPSTRWSPVSQTHTPPRAGPSDASAATSRKRRRRERRVERVLDGHEDDRHLHAVHQRRERCGVRDERPGERERDEGEVGEERAGSPSRPAGSARPTRAGAAITAAAQRAMVRKPRRKPLEPGPPVHRVRIEHAPRRRARRAVRQPVPARSRGALQRRPGASEAASGPSARCGPMPAWCLLSRAPRAPAAAGVPRSAAATCARISSTLASQPSPRTSAERAGSGPPAAERPAHRGHELARRCAPPCSPGPAAARAGRCRRSAGRPPRTRAP